MRKLIYYIASTVDGFIARKDGSFDFFLTEGNHFDYLFSEFPETVPGHLREGFGVHGDNKHFDTVVTGRKTYEVASNVGITNPYPHMRQVLFSQSMSVSPEVFDNGFMINHYRKQ